MALNVQERHMEASIREAQGLTIERRISFSSCPSLKTFERFMARKRETFDRVKFERIAQNVRFWRHTRNIDVCI